MGLFSNKKQIKKTITIGKDKWVLVGKNFRSISISLKEFRVGRYNIKYKKKNYEPVIIEAKSMKIKLSDAKPMNVYVKSIENSEVEITR